MIPAASRVDKILPSKTALELAKKVLAIEAEAIQGLAARLDQSFLDALALLLNCKGRVIVSGIGKSVHIARKLASTMPRTCPPAATTSSASTIRSRADPSVRTSR